MGTVSGVSETMNWGYSEEGATCRIPPDVRVQDVGVIGLASHDMFTWDRETQTNREDGRLNLSTIFDYDGGRRWELGGNPKNSENAPVYTVTMSLLDYYREQKKVYLETLPDEQSSFAARQDTVRHFHSLVEDSYGRIMSLPFPEEGLNQNVTHEEQAVMRALHDILPGRIQLFRPGAAELVLTESSGAQTRLNDAEMAQVIPYFNGTYDEEYLNIRIVLGPVNVFGLNTMGVNLKEADQSFIEGQTAFEQAEMLSQLAQVGAFEMSLDEVPFMSHIQQLFSKGICSTGQEVMPTDKSCL